MKELNRREFLGLATAGLALAYGKPGELEQTVEIDRSIVSAEQAREIYRKNIVIDCLATPVTFNIPCCPPPDQFTEEQLNNVRHSGITAVNLGLCCPSDIKEAYGKIAFWHGEIYKHSSDLLLVRKTEDIVHAKQVNKLGIIIGFQTAEMFGEELEIIQDFYNLGMRIQQLTYNKRNLIGNGCLEPRDGGLSRFGRKVVARLNELGVAIDLSHCGTQTTADGIEYSKKPVLISHSGCREVYQHPRNKEDRELRAMADHGGVVGIYLMSFLGNDGTLYANKEMVLDHLDHAINVCGTEHVGIGSDLSITPVEETPGYFKAFEEDSKIRQKLGIAAPEEDHHPYIPELNYPRRLEGIAEAMTERGYSFDTIEKVIGGNFHRVLKEIWGG